MLLLPHRRQRPRLWRHARVEGRPGGDQPHAHRLHPNDAAGLVPYWLLTTGYSPRMRILVVADIHANWPALAAINEPHDVCLCLGDLVDYGPDPGPCVRWAMEHATYAIRGNHDHGVAQRVLVMGDKGYR